MTLDEITRRAEEYEILAALGIFLPTPLEWISVEEKLPELDRYEGKASRTVIGFILKGEDEEQFPYVYYTREGWCYAYGEFCYETITHYRDLPEPPKQ